MEKKMKKMISLVAALLVVSLFLVFGCSKETETSKSKVESPAMTAASPQEVKQVAVKVKDAYTETAKKGDSVTRLARQAISQYIKDAKKTLTKEQRVYSEDSIAKHVKNIKLNPGDKVEFSSLTLNKVTEASLSIDTKNLTKYVKRIKWEV